MSTYYETLKPAQMTFGELKEKLSAPSAMQEYGMMRHQTDEDRPDAFCVFDGENYLWIHGNPRSTSISFARYGVNDVDEMIVALSDMLDAEIIDEYDNRYGQQTKETMKS